MKGFLGFISFLIVGFGIVNVLYLWGLSYIDWDFTKTKEAYHFRDKSYKTLVFGNSTALDGVNTENLSKSFGSAYNFSIGGASLETNYIQFKEYLRVNKKPDRVLLMLSSCHINYNKGHEINPIVQYYYDDISIVRLTQLPLFKFRWLFVENLKKILSNNHRSAKVVAGQLQIDKTIPDTSIKSLDNCSKVEDYSGFGYQFVNRFYEACLKANIELYIFEMPCWNRFQNKCKDGFIQLDGTPIRITNLNNSVLCDSILNARTDWLSENHLNLKGSVKLTKEIAKLLSGQ